MKGQTMNEQEAEVKLKVNGEYACFTRPEFKVERVSYPVMTPSAARGVLEAIYWKPEIRYFIKEILILKQGTQTTIMRNEISSKQDKNPIVIEKDKERQQRTSLILKDVEYLIVAKMVLRPHTKHKIENYLPQFIRRRDKGQCFHQPYLGNREFSADFSKPNGTEQCDPLLQGHIVHLGQMLLDIAFIREERREEDFLYFLQPGKDGQTKVKGCKQALFFNAKLENGVLRVPQSKYRELVVMEGKHA
jgi:CRISPR-associated protein Cas5d